MGSSVETKFASSVRHKASKICFFIIFCTEHILVTLVRMDGWIEYENVNDEYQEMCFECTSLACL